MATRKDLLKAHTFLTRRLVAALVDRDPDNPQPPLRRLGAGMFVGVMVGVIVLAGFGVVGLIRPGNSKSWKQDNTVIVDSTSGGVLVFIGGRLYPTHNITSAVLAAGGRGSVRTVKSKAMRDFPREPTIGIPKAPTTLPTAKELTAYPIRTCSVAAPVTARDGERFTTLEIGQGQSPADSVSFIARADGSGGKEYLVTEGRAHEIANHSVAIQLGFGERALTPGNAWLRSLPQGPPLTPIPIAGRGARSTNPVAGADPTVGALYHVEGPTATTWYVLLDKGLSEITPVEAAVLMAYQNQRSQPIRAADANAARNTAQPQAGREGMPRGLPRPTEVADPARTTVCATWPAAGEPARIAFGAVAPPVDTQHPDPDVADVVVMPALRGALVRHEGTVGPAEPGTLIVAGRRYGIADEDSQKALGFGDVRPVPVSGHIIRMVPEGLDPGQALSTKAARQMS